ncbi:hypothetical protein T492DRAFT_844046 [Pavlovales sp. CCMP2436]|nr:hypothetical protein T492DRAFT_844046 [Pavlovales sp. CCMP2436]
MRDVWIGALLLALVSGSPPYSRVPPKDLGVLVVKRSAEQAPAPERWVAAEGAPDLESGSLARPTNAWWTNFVLGQGASEMENGNGFAIPFILWPHKQGVSACLPFVLAQANQARESARPEKYASRMPST